MIAVGAVDANGIIASFSSPGPTYDGRIKPEVCAMGVRTIVAASTAPTGEANYQWGSGTSYATPLVAGVAAGEKVIVDWPKGLMDGAAVIEKR